MASRVNLKFVFGLGSVLVLIAVVVAFFGLRNWMAPGVEQNIDRGRQAEKEGDLKKAIAFYGRAVNKDRGNLEAIKIWLDAIQRYTPTNRQAYEDMYVGEYTAALRVVPTVDRKNPEAFRRYFDERYKLTERAGSSLRGWESFTREYDDLIKSFQGDDAAKAGLVRFRGLARAGMLQHNPELGEDSIKEGIADLEVAAKADPADGDVVLAIGALKRGLADRAARLGRQSEADRELAEARERLASFVAAHPENQRARYIQLSEKINESTRAAAKEANQQSAKDAGKDPTQKKGVTLQDILITHRADIVALADVVKSAPPEKTDVAVALKLAPWLMTTAPLAPDEQGQLFGKAGIAERDALMAAVAAGHATDPVFLLGSASLENSVKHYQQAMDACKKVVALPDKPMSLDGLLLHQFRSRALIVEADTAFAWWEERDTTLEKREELLNRIRDLRKELAARVGETDNTVLGIDGRLALASGDIPGARTMISAFNEQTGNTDAGMLLLEATILNRINQKGIAKDKFLRVLQVANDNTSAIIRAHQGLAEIEAGDRNYAEAASHLHAVLNFMPSDARTKEAYDRAVSLIKGTFDADPVTGVLNRYQEALTGTKADAERAQGILEDAVASGPTAGDPRLSIYLAQHHLMKKDAARARSVLEACAKLHPDNKDIQTALSRVDRDPLQLLLERIDGMSVTPVQKLLMRYQAYFGFATAKERESAPLAEASKEKAAALAEVAKFRQQASAALAEAGKLEPDNPAVIDAQFDSAIMNRDEAEQDRLVAKAQSLNLDRVGGTLYKSRALIARGKIGDAIGGFREVVQKDKINLLAWRLLGMALLEEKRFGESIDALKTAVGIKPDDLPSIDSYLQALVSAGREGEALDFARKSERVAGSDPTFFEMYMLLEAKSAGGDKAKAIAARTAKAKSDDDSHKDPAEPAVRSNKANLATLLVNADKMTEAEALIRQLRNSQPADPVALQIEAAYLGRKGDLPGAVKLVRDFIGQIPEADRKVELYINTARLLRQLGQPEDALKTLEGARPRQDPKTALIDREIGDMLYEQATSIGDPDPAKALAKAKPFLDKSLAAYQRVLDGGGVDEKSAVRKRMIEVCLREQNFERMSEIIAQLPVPAQGESTVLLLQAEAASAQKDGAKAIKFYDQAVTADPKDAIVYFKRGDFRAANGQIKDAISDFELMKRVDPGNVLARARLAKWYRAVGRDADAVQAVKECISIDPFNEQFYLALGVMLSELGKATEAAQAMDQAATTFPNNRQWRFVASSYWARVPDWGRAVDHMLLAWKESKTPDVAIPLVEYLLNKGDVTNAFNVLQARELEAAMKTSLPLILLRARVLARSNRTGEAAQILNETLKSVDPDSNEATSLFISGVTSIYPAAADQLTTLDRLESGKPFTSWLSLKANSIRLRDDAAKPKALQALRALTEGNAPPKVKAATWSVLGTECYGTKDFEQARSCFQKGVELDAENPELCNNYAYILSVKLGKCEDALPFALKAARADSQNSGYLDTLGATQLCNKNYDQAIQTLNLALNVAKNDAERVPVYIHLGRVRASKGDATEARRLANQARDLMSTLPTVRSQYEPDLKDLERAIDSK